MTDGEYILRSTGLALGYGRQTILHDINLHVRPGEFWFFLGPNGHGKSTFFHGILGLIPPKAGRLWLHPERARRDRVGFVPQRCDLNPSLPTTVQEFVLLGLVGVPAGADARQRLAWALDRVGLGGMGAHDYWSLSGGQRQRALVARALVRRPSLLLLDEPAANLDLCIEDALLALLADLNRTQQLTVLLATHDIHVANLYASHVALFRSPTVTAGPRHEVLTADNLQRVFEIRGASRLFETIPGDASAVETGR